MPIQRLGKDKWHLHHNLQKKRKIKVLFLRLSNKPRIVGILEIFVKRTKRIRKNMIVSGKDQTQNNQCTRKRLGDLKHYAIHTIKSVFDLNV